MRKRKYSAIESRNEPNRDGNSIVDPPPVDDIRATMNAESHENSNQESTEEETTNNYKGGVFIVRKEDARYALSRDQDIWEIWLTNPEQGYNTYDGKKRSFLTLWVSEAMGEELGKRSKLMVANGKNEANIQTC